MDSEAVEPNNGGDVRTPTIKKRCRPVPTVCDQDRWSAKSTEAGELAESKVTPIPREGETDDDVLGLTDGLALPLSEALGEADFDCEPNDCNASAAVMTWVDNMGVQVHPMVEDVPAAIRSDIEYVRKLTCAPSPNRKACLRAVWPELATRLSASSAGKVADTKSTINSPE